MKRTITIAMLLAICSLAAKAQWVKNGLTASSVTALTANSGNIFAGAGDGVYLSGDNGVNWSSVSTGLPASPYIRALAISGINIFAGTFQQGVYLSSNNGTSWTAVNTGLVAGASAYAFAINGSNIFASFNLGGVYLSTNNGTNWAQVNNGLPGTIVNAFAIIGNTVFAGTTGYGVSVSSNNGTYWSASSTGLPAGTNVNALLVNGTDIFAGTDNGIYLSVDNGSNWSAISTGLPANTSVRCFAVNGSTVFAGTAYDGIYVSANNGTSWTVDNTGLNYIGTTVYAFAINSSTLFAGLGSVWQTQLGTTGIDMLGNPSSIVVYPNPSASGIFTISPAGEDKSPVELIVYDILGKQVYAEKITQNNSIVNLSALQKGIYFARINTSRGLMQQKLVIE